MVHENGTNVDYMEFKARYWKRPEGPPRVWRVIDGRRKLESGEIPKFSIQEVPKKLEDEVAEFMLQNFLREEPTCKDQGYIPQAMIFVITGIDNSFTPVSHVMIRIEDVVFIDTATAG